MKISKVKDCIAYMEGIGWHFQYFNRPRYVFRSSTNTTWNGSSEMTFTITELRHAYNNGFLYMLVLTSFKF